MSDTITWGEFCSPQVSKADEPLGMMELHYVEAARNRGDGVKTFRFTATIVLALVLFGALSAPASAQTVNRTNVPAGEAVPTGGTFSIRFPTAFTDLEARAKADTPGGTDAVVRMLTGLNGDGVEEFLPRRRHRFQRGNSCGRSKISWKRPNSGLALS